MSNILIGTIQKMTVQEIKEESYELTNHRGEVVLPKADDINELTIGHTIDVFIYTNKAGVPEASHHLPEATISMYGWGKVVEMLPNLGVFIDLGTSIDILVSMDNLPSVIATWPEPGDQLYVRLKKDKKDRLLAVPASEHEFNDIIEYADKVELNDTVQGHVIRPGKEGTVMLTEERFRGFIHHSERDKEPRLGELISGRVIEVKENGTLNVSMLPLKHERIEGDAEKILHYIETNGGSIPFSNKTDPDKIREVFNMSKSAFKRALGRLMKEGKITQENGHSTLL